MNKPTVINIKDAPKGWTTDPQYIYIGRARTHPERAGFIPGPYGNPHLVGYRCPRCSTLDNQVFHERGSTIELFEKDLREAMESNSKIAEEIKGWGGKILVCFCKPHDCHGDVYVKIWEELQHQTHIIVTELGSGWAAVQLWWNDREEGLDPFWEPWQTGIGRYATAEEAEVEAKEWAEAEEQEYRGIQ